MLLAASLNLGRSQNGVIVDRLNKLQKLRTSESFVNMFNSLPHEKILDQSKFQALADNKINATEKFKFVLGMVENILEKGKNAGYQHFLLFPKCFQKPPSAKSLKVWIVW